jgi:hypothetical protein
MGMEEPSKGPVARFSCGVDKVRLALEHRPGTLFAILDACDEPDVPPLVQALGDNAVSLYRGPAEIDLAEVAPYLVLVDEHVLAWIEENVWSRPWGYFLVSKKAGLHELRRHFRRFLTAQAPDGQEVYFRFYDPRILPMYLEAALPDEAEAFFGPVKYFFLSQEPGRLHILSLAQSLTDSFSG